MMSEKISARDENLQLAVVVDNDDTTYFKSVIEYADLAFSLKDGILTMIKCRG